MSFYHVRISLKDTSQADEVKLDLSLEKLEEGFVRPYKSGRTIVINGKAIAIDDLERIIISVSDQDSSEMRDEVVKQRLSSRVISAIPVEWDIAGAGRDVTDEFIMGPPGWEVDTEQGHPSEARPSVDTREVFVVHGRNEKARKALYEFLRSIDLRPIPWAALIQQTGKGSPYIGDVLNAAFSRAQAVVVLFTPDDEARLRNSLRGASEPPHETELTGQARPNVLFEAGMAMARHHDRTILVELGHLRPFSDVSGLHVVRLDNSFPCRQALAQRLETAGCPVNLQDSDWHSAGDFEAALEESVQLSSEEATSTEKQTITRTIPKLSKESRVLLLEAVDDDDGEILKVAYMGGVSITTKGREFIGKRDPRLEAMWKGALIELIDSGFVKDEAGNGQVFRVTREGFEAADAFEGLQ